MMGLISSIVYGIRVWHFVCDVRRRIFLCYGCRTLTRFSSKAVLCVWIGNTSSDALLTREGRGGAMDRPTTLVRSHRGLSLILIGVACVLTIGCGSDNSVDSPQGAGSQEAGGLPQETFAEPSLSADPVLSSADPAPLFTLSSVAFSDNGEIPLAHACTLKGGDNISPTLAWSDAPDGTARLALIVDDESLPCGTGASACKHWQVYNIPADMSGFEKGQAVSDISGVTQGVNWDLTSNYAGPCPPNEHVYTFTLYALSGSVPAIEEGTALTRSQFQGRFEEHILGSAILRGLFAP